MANPNRGEVWLADLGYAAKMRPCLVLSTSPADTDRALIALVPHTTSIPRTRFEVAVAKPFLKPGAFDAQGLVTVAPPRLNRRLGALQASEIDMAADAVRMWLAL